MKAVMLRNLGCKTEKAWFLTDRGEYRSVVAPYSSWASLVQRQLMWHLFLSWEGVTDRRLALRFSTSLISTAHWQGAKIVKAAFWLLTRHTKLVTSAGKLISLNGPINKTTVTKRSWHTCGPFLALQCATAHLVENQWLCGRTHCCIWRWQDQSLTTIFLKIVLLYYILYYIMLAKGRFYCSLSPLFL